MAQTLVYFPPQIPPLQALSPQPIQVHGLILLPKFLFMCNIQTVETVHISATSPNMLLTDLPSSVLPLLSFVSINISLTSMVQSAGPVVQATSIEEPKIATYPMSRIGQSHNTGNTLSSQKMHLCHSPSAKLLLLKPHIRNELLHLQPHLCCELLHFTLQLRKVIISKLRLQMILLHLDLQKLVKILISFPSTRKANIMQHSEPLTEPALANAAPEEWKGKIGNRLYPYVEKFYPELAGKVTGMLLELDNDYLIQILKDEKLIKEKSNEVFSVIEVTCAKEEV